MTAARLKYLSNATIEELREHLSDNVDRYRAGNFDDLVSISDGSIELNLDVDLAPLAELDPSGTPEAEIANSRLVWKALHGLTPTLACEEGIWTRLTHIECLGFARARWLGPDLDDDAVKKAVADHFFAPTLTGRRDDNAVSRLWWNAYVAHLAIPGSELKALDLILKKADIRSNFVERSLTASRAPLAAGIVRIMQREAWVSGREENFRAFMRTLNRLGGGMVFESMSEADVDKFMDQCARRAGLPSEANLDR
jgi:Family of unknown function (DUF6339)